MKQPKKLTIFTLNLHHFRIKRFAYHIKQFPFLLVTRIKIRSLTTAHERKRFEGYTEKLRSVNRVLIVAENSNQSSNRRYGRETISDGFG